MYVCLDLYVYKYHCIFFSQNPLIQPAITPSSIGSSSEAQLKALGDIARDRNLPIQSHLCEQKSARKYFLSFWPGYANNASVFEATGMMTSKVRLYLKGKYD